MFLFVEMNSNLTSGLLCSHSRLVVAESDLNLLEQYIVRYIYYKSIDKLHF